METTKQILNRYGDAMVTLLRNLVAPKSVTGKTVKSIHYTVTPTDNGQSLKVYARPYLITLEKGRGPRKASQASGFKDNLAEWLQKKQFESKQSKTGVLYYKIGGQWYSAKSLAWKINKEGDKTFRDGGHDLFVGQIKIIQDSLVKTIAQSKAQEYLTSLKSAFE